MASLHKFKRQRVDLTGSEKRKICEVHQKHPELKHEELAKYMVEHHGFRLVSRSTISKLLDEQQKWLKVDSKLPEGSCRRSREPKWPEFEKALLTWFGQVRERTGTVSDVVLLQKAHEFRSLFDISENDFKLSNGWLARFKARYGIAAHRDFHGESTNADAPSAATSIFKLPDFVNSHNEAVEVDETLADSNDDNVTDLNDIEPNIEPDIKPRIEPRVVKLKDAQFYARELLSFMLDNTQTFTAAEVLLISQLCDKFTKMHVAQLIASKQL